MSGDLPELPPTLTQFFSSTRQTVRIYDMGRRVVRLTGRIFEDFELTRCAYPLPLRRNAWLGLLFWARGGRGDPLIWFLKFPLDEQGKLLQASRDYVLRRIYETYGARLGRAESAKDNAAADGGAGAGQGVLEDNPFAFRPAQARLAVFRAKSTLDLGLAPSSYYALAHDYFTGHMARAQWAELGLQGIADLAARIGKADQHGVIADGVANLPSEPFVAFCNCLESERISTRLARAIAARSELALRHGEEATVVAAGIRGLSRARTQRVNGALVDMILGAPLGADIEILASVAGRAWELLDDAGRRARFLERLANSAAGQQGFDAIVSDLLYMPGLRSPLLSTLRDRKRSKQLEMRMGVLFAGATSGPRGSSGKFDQ